MTSGMRPDGSRTPISRRGLTVAAIIAALLVVGVIANAAGARKHARAGQTTVSSKPTLAASQSPSPSPVKLPNFAFRGDPHCAITYRARGTSAMTWTALVTIAGQLITHASSRSGNIYRRVAHVTPGPNVFTAPVPLLRINDVGGVLYTTSTSYGCSVAPYRPGHRVPRKPRPHARHIRTPRRTPATSPTPVPSPTPVAQPSTAASCYPLSNEGTCYEPGEFCRDSDHGATGLAGDGEKIECEDNDGWRWEPV
jgi:hypothetical protein